jgi:protein-L-isoaspartate(D-aspartate) O-methyltransferase
LRCGGSILVWVACLAAFMAGCRATAVAEPATEQASTAVGDSDGYAAARRRMVETGIIGWGITDPAVIAVMGEVPRHLFVSDDDLDQAYANHPLPIGYGQTISQPYIVALMTQELGVEPGERILEIGTGSGYQAAILAALGAQVYTIEIIQPLAEAARDRLRGLGYSSVETRIGDGYLGWAEAAPFDGIIVTAAPDHVPPVLLDQLRIGGVMVIPVGPVGDYQELWRIVRLEKDQYESTSLGGVRFVPLVHPEDLS